MGVKLTMGDIAELAGVTRPAVSNWRRRYEDFPPPVEENVPQPLFDSTRVNTWLDSLPLRATEKLDGHETYGERFRERLRLRTISELRGTLPGDDLVARGIALAAVTAILREPFGAIPYHQISQKRPDLVNLFKDPLGGLDTEKDRLSEIVAEMLQEASPVDVADRLLEQADRVGSTIRARTTPQQVSELIAAISAEKPWRSIYDPAAGFGTLLRRLLRGSSLKASEIFAADEDMFALRLLRLSLLAENREVTAHCQNSFTANGIKADLVILDSPVVAGDDNRQELPDPFRWVRLAHRHLNPGGRALVVVPAWALKKTRARDRKAKLRAELTQKGLIRAVVRFPPRVHSFHVAAELALVVVDQQPDPERRVLLVEAGTLARSYGVGWIAEVASLLRDPPTEPGKGIAWVRAADCDDRRSLLPEPSMAEPPTENTAADLLDAQHRLARLFPDDQEFQRMPVVTNRAERVFRELGTYKRSKQLVLIPGHRIASRYVGQGSTPLVGVEELRNLRRIGDRTVDELALGIDLGGYEAVRLTLPGDVIVLSIDQIHAYVDVEGDKVVEAPAQVLRISRRKREDRTTEEPRWMTPRVLAALLMAIGVPEHATGPLVRRVNLAELRLPELTPDEVATLDSVLRQVEERETGLRFRLAALRSFETALMTGVADGSLRVIGESVDDS
ncbi:N-6 DNA methylase [Streptosporangium sp. CA-115845]|uniref:N-6 DNA methylase n=1 Tax=Streptosporangium sp. CA-115845 TaxID=3240071 RepID=UPI003D8B669B